MLSSLRNMFKVPDLRNKILFTLLIIALYRLGAYVPAPGIDLDAVEELQAPGRDGGGVLGFLQLFSGGALTQFAIFALGIMPYITASIIMQILTVVIPKLEQWQQQGAVGQRKITQWTRYLTVAHRRAPVHRPRLPVPQRRRRLSAAAATPPASTCCPSFTPFRVIIVVLTLTAGTALLMWMGELITQRGIGNGMSLLIFASVVSSLPGRRRRGSTPRRATPLLIALLAARRRCCWWPSCSSSRASGGSRCSSPSGWSAGACTAARAPTSRSRSTSRGVIPIIFASSVLYLPLLLTNVLPADGWGADGAATGSTTTSCSPTRSSTWSSTAC